jgi:hypothetical protein
MYIVSQKYVNTDVDMDETGSVVALCANQIENLDIPLPPGIPPGIWILTF